MKINIHILIAVIGMITVWLVTSFVYANINPFELSTDIRGGMIGFYAMFQLLIQGVYYEYKYNN